MTPNGSNDTVTLEIIRASEVTPREVKWLWYPYIPFGKITLLQGDPGDGKSKFMLDELNGSRMSSLTLYRSIACRSRSSPKVRCFSFSLMKIRLSRLPPEAINLGTTVSSASSSVVW